MCILDSVLSHLMATPHYTAAMTFWLDFEVLFHVIMLSLTHLNRLENSGDKFLVIHIVLFSRHFVGDLEQMDDQRKEWFDIYLALFRSATTTSTTHARTWHTWTSAGKGSTYSHFCFVWICFGEWVSLLPSFITCTHTGTRTHTNTPHGEKKKKKR